MGGVLHPVQEKVESNRRMNHVLRKLTSRRCALKNNRGMYGGGLAVNTLAPYMSSNQAPIESRTYTDDCYAGLRPGEVRAEPNPALAQVAMAGGAIASPISRLRRFLTRRQAGGRCPCLDGGAKRRRTRGGSRGFAVDPSMNVGGNGPIAAAANVPIPCDARAGSANPFAVQALGSDPRAAVGYSLTPNQTAPIVGGNYAFAATQAGGAYGHSKRGGAYEGPDCYKAPGSQMPVYPATSAGFDFTPSTAAGASYSDGVTPFMEVNPRVARVGGVRKSLRKIRSMIKKTMRRR
jgi:hypothetical protein